MANKSWGSMGTLVDDDPHSGETGFWEGAERGKNAWLHLSGWERGFDIFKHLGGCDLNPKKEIQRVWKGEHLADRQ